jgi:hypothetical protein
MNNLAPLVLRTQPNGIIYFTNTLTGENFFPCDVSGNLQDITRNALGYVEYVRSIGNDEIHSLDGFLKKVSDRLFRDFPKAFTNAITSPFTSEPIFKQTDFKDQKYGAAAASVKNNRITGQAGQIAASVVLGPTNSAKFMAAGNTSISFLQRNQSQNLNDQAVQQATAPDQPYDPGKTEKDSTMLLVASGVGILLVSGLIFFLASQEGEDAPKKKKAIKD